MVENERRLPAADNRRKGPSPSPSPKGRGKTDRTLGGGYYPPERTKPLSGGGSPPERDPAAGNSPPSMTERTEQEGLQRRAGEREYKRLSEHDRDLAVRMYWEFYPKNYWRLTEIAKSIAKVFGVSERTIWSYIKKSF